MRGCIYGRCFKRGGGFSGLMGMGEKGKYIHIKRGILQETASSERGREDVKRGERRRGGLVVLGLDFGVAVDDDDDDDDDGRALLARSSLHMT